MPSFLETIRSWFEPDPGIRNARSAEGFEALDPDKVFAEFKLGERAKNRALMLGSSPTPNTPDENENTIRAHFVAYENEQLSIARRRISGYRTSLDNAALLFNLNVLQLRVDAGLADATARAAVCEDRFHIEIPVLRTARDQLDDFRRRNGLTRVLPKNQGWDPIVKWALVFGALVVEAAANVGFYATAFKTGLIAAYAIAIAISVINVLIPLQLSKKLIVQMNSPSTVWRSIGWISLFSTIAFVIALNLFTSHIREAGIQGQASGVTEIGFATQLALKTFIENPLGLTDAFSVLMLVIGIFFGAMAAVGGYNFDDPFPGFGDVWRQYKAKQQILLGLIEETYDEIQESFSDIGEEIDSRIESLAGSQAKVARARENIENVCAQIERFQNQLRVSFEAVVQRYRAELAMNGLLIGDIGAPAYQAANFDPHERGAVDPDVVTRLLEEAERALPRLQTKLRQRNEELTARVQRLHGAEGL